MSEPGPLIQLLRLLPRNAMSRLAGRVARIPLARPLRAPLLGAFGRVVGVDFDEIRDPVRDFPDLQSFFTRALREGARPVDPATDALVAPCDGAWGEAGIVEDGLLLQVKGRPYSLASLLGDEDRADRCEGGAYATFYLSPRDYHRFHTPCAVRIVEATYVPGTLWPVNRAGLEGVEGLFAENERICAVMEVEHEGSRSAGGALHLVAVGATMVGKIRLSFDELTTNEPGAEPCTHRYAGAGVELDKGAEWGRFEFGSTIVMVAEPGLLELDARPPGTPLRLGARIGRITAAAVRHEP